METHKRNNLLLKKPETIEELLKTCPINLIIPNNLIVAWSKINDDKYKNILCSISGGSDSDIMLDIIWRCDKDNKITYVWFDTGIEYQKTKEHLLYLEEKYNITIHELPLPCGAVVPMDVVLCL